MAEIGWIGLHRKIINHWLFPTRRKFTELEAWLYLLLRASFVDSKILDGNSLILVKRGDLLTSEHSLAITWRWDRSKVRSFLFMLENDAMIVKKSSTKNTIITICNYDDYQNFTTTVQQQINHDSTTKQQQNNTLEEVKEVKQGISKTFTPPTLPEVINYMCEKLDDFTAQGEADKFINFYQSKGWMVGKTKMKDWQAAVRNWVKNVPKSENQIPPSNQSNILDLIKQAGK